MRPALATLVLLAAACSNPAASLIATSSSSGTATGPTTSGSSTSSGSSSGGGVTSTGGESSTGAASTSSSGSFSGSSTWTGTTTGSARFSCDLGDGGLFGNAIAVSTGLTFTADYHPIDVGDLNGDGNLDIVVSDSNSGDFVVLFGNGDGTFRQSMHTSIPAPHLINSRGPLELQVAILGSTPAPSLVLLYTEDATVVVTSVQNTGTLTSVAFLDAGYQGSSDFVRAADFNQDGMADLAVFNQGGITVFLGDNSASYSTVTSLGFGACAANCFGDFNGDGIPDVLVAQSLSLSVYLGIGDGTFSTVGIASSSSSSLEWALGDVNEDGHLDVATSLSSVDGQYGILLGAGDGTFTTGPAPTIPPSLPQMLQDLNGDGHLDYVALDVQGANELLVSLGNGDGTFQQLIALIVPVAAGSPWQVVVGDVNNDGRPDLIASHSQDSDVTIFLNNCR